jgi:hypothetical protein
VAPHFQDYGIATERQSMAGNPLEQRFGDALTASMFCREQISDPRAAPQQMDLKSPTEGNKADDAPIDLGDETLEPGMQPSGGCTHLDVRTTWLRIRDVARERPRQRHHLGIAQRRCHKPAGYPVSFAR